MEKRSWRALLLMNHRWGMEKREEENLFGSLFFFCFCSDQFLHLRSVESISTGSFQLFAGEASRREDFVFVLSSLLLFVLFSFEQKQPLEIDTRRVSESIVTSTHACARRKRKQRKILRLSLVDSRRHFQSAFRLVTERSKTTGVVFSYWLSVSFGDTFTLRYGRKILHVRLTFLAVVLDRQRFSRWIECGRSLVRKNDVTNRMVSTWICHVSSTNVFSNETFFLLAQIFDQIWSPWVIQRTVTKAFIATTLAMSVGAFRLSPSIDEFLHFFFIQIFGLKTRR